ncbi:MMPL family transporter [Gillisia hiemivivida]|uniref:MMPL family transporter n=1 Tax=Gillisia hiemivivida TaxID=291190 RepID=A0A5C6ZTV7_9FLAO|nr:MMPL family transporter [Gillisia hiemivivida]TXD94175.1 MMPL family transporter [Gillisia hiemivivida]
MFNFNQYLKQHKYLAIFSGILILSLLSFLASKINLEEDITSLIPEGAQQDVLKRVLDQTEFSDKIIVTISSTSGKSSPEELTKYAQRFIDTINSDLPEYVKNIQGKVPEEGILEIYDFVYNNLPLFLNNSDYEAINNRLELDTIQQRLKDDYKSIISPTGLVTKDFIFKDPLSFTNLGLKKLEELQVGDDFKLYNSFLLTKDEKHLLLFLSPTFPSSETDKNTVFIEKLKEIQNSLNAEYSFVNAEFFGGVLYSVANANQIKKDIKLTLGFASGVLLLLLIFYYRRIYIPLILFVPSIIGAITAIAVLYIFKGSISAISVGIGAILLGISLDYALHILTHYKNNNDLPQLYKDVTGPILMSSGTTAVAFLCLLFVKSEALNDLGIFAAVSVLVASVVALILIPILYRVPKGNVNTKETFIDKIAGIAYHKKSFLVIAILGLFVFSLFYFTKVQFNNDLSAINFEPTEIKQAEKQVQSIAGNAAKSIYLVTYGNTTDEALEANNELYEKLNILKDSGKIEGFSSIGGVVLSTNTQQEKINKWKDFWTQERQEKLKSTLITESSEFGFRPESFESLYDQISKDFDPIYLEDYRETKTLYLDDFLSSKQDLATVTTSINLDPETSEEILSTLKESKNVVVIDRKQLNQSFLGNLKNDFNQLISYSIIAVFLILLICYRSFVLSFLTLLPIGITWVIALGMMAFFNIEFNILNIIISTFIFGLGLDYSIFITNAFLKEYEFGTKVLKTYRTSILLSVITTLLGIGALFFAKHPALRSISIVSIIGVFSAVSVAFILQGAIFDFLFIRPREKGLAPYTALGLAINFNKNSTKDKLYFKKEIIANYRYKKIYRLVKKDFEKNKDRYLKVAEFFDNENILHFYSDFGLLSIYLHFKNPENLVTGLELDLEKLQIANNCYAAQSEKLNFENELPENFSEFKSIVICKSSNKLFEKEIHKLVAKQVEKVIILDKDYAYQWIVDSNFEIHYRQNGVILLQRMV